MPARERRDWARHGPSPQEQLRPNPLHRATAQASAQPGLDALLDRRLLGGAAAAAYPLLALLGDAGGDGDAGGGDGGGRAACELRVVGPPSVGALALVASRPLRLGDALTVARETPAKCGAPNVADLARMGQTSLARIQRNFGQQRPRSTKIGRHRSTQGQVCDL